MSSKTCLRNVFSLSSVLTFFWTRSFNYNLFNRANTLFSSCELRAYVTTSRMGGREMAALLWFIRTTKDVVQTTTPN